MKYLILRYRILGVFVLLWFSNVTATPIADSLAAMSDSERVAMIFPFEVGQQYQFKCSGVFQRPNGETLEPYTVAEVTITDTVINDVTWLRIPYWSPFGSEIYRLADDLRIMAWDTYWESEYWILDLKLELWPGSGGECVNHFPYTYEGSYGLSRCGPKHRPWSSWGWMNVKLDSAKTEKIIYHAGISFPWITVNKVVWTSWGVHSWYGRLYGSGSSLQGTGHLYMQETDNVNFTYLPLAKWALFRPKSDAAWPELDPISTTDVDENKNSSQNPSELTLSTFPNPFNPTVTIRYTLPSTGMVHMKVYSITGQVIRTLIHAPQTQGSHIVSWNGKDDNGRIVGSGVYLVHMVTPQNRVIKRITLIR